MANERCWLKGERLILNANIYDLEGIYQCAIRFFDYAKYEKEHGLVLDEKTFKDTVAGLIKSDDGIVLLIKGNEFSQIKGGISGILVSSEFNKEYKRMCEFFYWVDPEYRGVESIKLIDKFEKIAWGMGADRIDMIQPHTELKDMVGRLYERRGYKQGETLWIKTR